MEFQQVKYYTVDVPDNYRFRRSVEEIKVAHGLPGHGELRFHTEAQALDWVKAIHTAYAAHFGVDPVLVSPRPVGERSKVEYRIAGTPTYTLTEGIVCAETPVEYRMVTAKTATKTVVVDGETYTKHVNEIVYGDWESSPDVKEQLKYWIYPCNVYLPKT